MIKGAAEESDDTDVLRDIQGVDVLAKEFQVHDKWGLVTFEKLVSQNLALPRKKTILATLNW